MLTRVDLNKIGLLMLFAASTWVALMRPLQKKGQCENYRNNL